MTFECDGCNETLTGARVVFSSEATDDSGIDVVLTKRWTVCADCADDVFTRIGEPNPWSDVDFKTVVQPGEVADSMQALGLGLR